MNELIGRSKDVLQQRGIRGLCKSSGAYLYNNGIFRLIIGGRGTYYTLRGHAGFQNLYQPLWIGPDQITHIYQGCFNQKTHLGQIKNGTWDKERVHITEYPVYNGLKQRFCEKRDWEDTIYYQRAVNRIRSGETHMGYTSVKAFNDRLKYIDQLYRDIRENGYRSQEQIADNDWDPHRHPVVTPAHKRVGEVGVNIARDGTILQNDGIHRLVIAKLVDVDKIPVQVIVRHQNWQSIRDKIANSSEDIELQSKYKSHPDIEALSI